MKRDLDLIRQILLEVEQNDNPIRPITVEAEGYSPDEISYHVMLLDQAGYLKANSTSHLRGISYQPKTLTWEGHEFLDAARNKTVWTQVKAKLKDGATSAPLSIIQQLATSYIAQALGLGEQP